VSIKVTLPTAFTRHTAGKKQFDSIAENLPALLADIDQTFPALGTQIKGEDGKLRRFINIYVNDEDIRFLGGETYSFQDGDEVMLIPSIAGERPFPFSGLNRSRLEAVVQKHVDQHDQENKSQSTAWIISPIAAVGP
jgi:molybdopterin converting factor small subunit